MRIGIYYGSTSGSTSSVATLLARVLNKYSPALLNIANEPVASMIQFDLVLCGIPTWNGGELQDDWELCWEELGRLNLSGKYAAVFGVGDQFGYPETYCNAMGLLYRKLQAAGAHMIGEWPADGYQCINANVLNEDKSAFVGLALDEEAQSEMSESRLLKWTDRILETMKASQT